MTNQRCFHKGGENPRGLIWSLVALKRHGTFGESIAKPTSAGVCANAIWNQENNLRSISTFTFLVRRLKANASSVKWNMAFS
jgi:hypothetical protein